eukprot:scaffold11431_cov118-Isochrysis_galbana.AAC.4
MKNRKTSTECRLSTSIGSTTLPMLLLILRPSGPCTNPCATTAFGSGNPADSSSAGQMMEWNHRMSLPMMCTSAGQNRALAPDG